MFSKKRLPLWRGLSGISLSALALLTMGYGIADTWRSTVDSALGTKSYVTDSSNSKYTSVYSTGDEVMEASKAYAVEQGAEGTVIMKNDNNVFPLAKTSKIALMGTAAYHSYYDAAGNSDQVTLKAALTAAGMTVDPTLDSIYTELATHNTTVTGMWGQTSTTYDYGPNFTTGDYDSTGFQIKEADPYTDFVTAGGATSSWKSSVDADVAVVVFCRPGGEGTTYYPGIAKDTDGKTLNQNPLAFSPDELNVVKAAKEVASKVIVLLNTSCTLEVGPLMSGEYAVDGIAYIGIPNDYQFTGIVQALDGDVNPTGALADTYAYSSTNSPAMVNFGGDYYSDYESLASDLTNYTDPRWPTTAVSNDKQGSFGGSASYNGGTYIAEAEDIYTGYNYYETRYYDTVLNQGNASSTTGSIDGNNWTYSNEVCYPFGYGLSYLDYTETLQSVSVETRAGGNITATINITNNGSKSGKFLGQLYVATPYTAYDKANKVEKSAIQFLSSGKVEVAAGATESVNITIPTKYLASYDYTTAKTYILDGGTYYFATGNGSHEALNNVLAAQGHQGDKTGDTNCVKSWSSGNENDTDTTTFSVSDSGAKITNEMAEADLNYYLPDTVTYLSRNDWKNTYPINYNTVNSGKGVTVSSSTKKDEWTTELRNQTYTVKTDDPVTNMNGENNNVTFSDITYDAQTNIKDEFWDKLVEEIPADESLGAIAHGGSQSDTLSNIKNPIVKQYDGPKGFNSTMLSNNNGEKGTDPYYVDPDTTAGKFMTNVNSVSLMGSTFDPVLAEKWGELLGNDGLWLGAYQIWAAALNSHRTPYNGRNTEYPSEDAMLSNILGKAMIVGSKKFGIIVGPKHIGFNDQEHNRAGISVYMNEQKFRETDLRGFQGAVEDAGSLGLMVAFNRLGATNASHDVSFLKGIIRTEWNFNGLISTDFMSNAYYFNPESCTMATITQMADFAGNNSTLSGGTNGVDATWSYLSDKAIQNDNALVEASRQCMKYQLYAFANSAVLNISTTRVTPSWEMALKVGIGCSIALSVVFVGFWVTTEVIGDKNKKGAK